jgi:putative oxidoreductase
MKYLYLVCRILLGIMFVFFGLNGIFNFGHMALPPTGNPVGDWIGVMSHSHWMHVVAVFQVIGGVLLLVGAVPLGLCILCPIIVNILCFHLLLPGAGGNQMFPGIGVAAMAFALLIGYRNSFMGIFDFKAKPVT